MSLGPVPTGPHLRVVIRKDNGGPIIVVCWGVPGLEPATPRGILDLQCAMYL